MKMDRNIEGNEGRGKYALLLLRNLARFEKLVKIQKRSTRLGCLPAPRWPSLRTS